LTWLVVSAISCVVVSAAISGIGETVELGARQHRDLRRS